MAFSIKGLMKIADLAPWADGAMPKTWWAYASPDAMTAIRVADYFLPAISLLKLGDVILVTAATGGTATFHFTYVNANTGTAIDVTDGTQISATDTD